MSNRSAADISIRYENKPNAPVKPRHAAWWWLILALLAAAWAAPAQDQLWVNDDYGRLFTVDVSNGLAANVGFTSVDGATTELDDLAFDGSGNLYGIKYLSSWEHLYWINPTNAVLRDVGSFHVGASAGTRVTALTCDREGVLWASSKLYRYKIGTNPFSSVEYHDVTASNIGDLIVDANNRLYGTEGSTLQEFSRTDGSEIGERFGGIPSDVTGLGQSPDGTTYGVTETRSLLRIDLRTGYYTRLDPIKGYFPWSFSIGNIKGATMPPTTNVPVAPRMISQPQSRTNAVGTIAQLSAFASGTAPLGYQWRKDGTNLVGDLHADGVTTRELTLSSVQLGDSGKFQLVVTNRVGSVTSAVAFLTVTNLLAAPTIVTHPQSRTNIAGQTATFTVVASGAAPLSYQWRKNGTNLPGTASATLSLPNVQPSDVAGYFVVIANTAGAVTSQVATLTVWLPPTITSQPQSRANAVGTTATFSVTATGTAPLSYQWRRGGSPITGATTANYSLSNVQLTDSGSQFSVVITNIAGAVTSQVATLTVTNVSVAPTITGQPQSRTNIAGQTATFTVAASGTAPLSYQWRKDGTNIPGITSAMLNLPNVQLGDAAAYSVVVTNAAGAVTSQVATLTVWLPPTITGQPQSRANAVGTTATFSVTATGTAPLSYQWRRGGSPITGATTANYSLSNVQLTDSGSQFSVVITNVAGAITSQVATLTVTNVLVVPAITGQPQSRTNAVGTTATFSATANGTAPLAYQWRRGGSPITGATTASYSLSNVQLTNSGSQFSVVITNVAGAVTSQVATLTVTNVPVAPTITSQPQSRTNAVGTTAIFSVTANGTAPLAYQWRRGGSPITGATTASYSLSNVQLTNSGSQFSVVITNVAGAVTSQVATLTVTNVPVAPTITSQPQSRTNAVRTTATFSVTATGTAPLAYQWRRGGSPITGATTTATYSLSNVQLTNSGSQFFVVITNVAGAVTSQVATLTVTNVPVAPTITGQPQSRTNAVGTTATFSVTANGTAPLAYQWRRGGSPITGATTATYSLSNVQLTNSGSQFSVVITNVAGAVTSQVATLTVTNVPVAPIITGQPQSRTNAVGTTATFSVTATGTAPLAYQWRRGGSPITGATTASYSLSNVQLTNSGSQFSVVITNIAGAVTSQVATLTVTNVPVAPTITGQPQSRTNAVGTTATFSVTANGTAPLAYQWRRGGSPIAGATAATYSLPNVQLADSGSQFSVVITNRVGTVASRVAVLTVIPPQEGTINFTNFADVSRLQLNGVATNPNQVLQLTPSDANQAGSAFLKIPVSLANAASFSTFFSFRLSQPGGLTDLDDVQGADGFVFVVQTVDNTVGALGGGIGYAGITNSVGIEYDTWYNDGNPTQDPVLPTGLQNPNGTTSDGNHVAISFNGNLDQAIAAHCPVALNNGQVWYSWVDYNGSTRVLEMRLSAAKSRPLTPTISTTIDLLACLKTSTAYVGFTAATGASYNKQDILSWQFNTTYQPIGLPSPWQHQDVGTPTLTGSAVYSNDVFTVRGSGTDIWMTNDQFHYVFQPIEGDVEITARVLSQQNTDLTGWAKAGIMVRDELRSDARHAAMFVSPQHGARFQWRPAAGGLAADSPTDNTTQAPCWLKLVRLGDHLIGYRSKNGVDWIQTDTVTLAMGNVVQVGMVVTAHNPEVLNTATFDSVGVRRPTGLPLSALRREVYLGIMGTNVADLTRAAKFPGTPDIVDQVYAFESVYLAGDVDDNFGQRLSGWLLPPESGNYNFYLASDDASELWLSTDESAVNKRLILSEPAWNAFRNWQGQSNANVSGGWLSGRCSSAIPLQAGRAYYVEALHKEAMYGDHLAVAWKRPGGTAPENGSAAIQGTYLTSVPPVLPKVISGAVWQDRNGNGRWDTNLLQGTQPDVVFLIDRSSSVRDPFAGAPVGDINGDGLANTMLDAELAGFIALNQSFIDQGRGNRVRVAIALFAGGATNLDMNPVLAGHQWAALAGQDADANGVADVEQCLRTVVHLNDTDYHAALQAARAVFQALGTTSGNGNVVFMSDGEPHGEDYTADVQALRAAGIHLRAFGAGTDATLAGLQTIDPQAQLFQSTDELINTLGGFGGYWFEREPGLSGVTVFLDQNNNQVLDTGESWTISQADNPVTTEIDETGRYVLGNGTATNGVVREVVPAGYRLSFPTNNPGGHFITAGSIASGLNFGNTATAIAPYITVQPQNQNGFAGQQCCFHVLAGGSSPLAYQWYFQHRALTGQTNSVLCLTNISAALAGPFFAVVTNFWGAVTSQVAVLSLETVTATHLSTPRAVPGTHPVDCQIHYPAGRKLHSLLWRPLLPADWQLLSATGQGAPEVRNGEILFLDSLSNNPIQFTYFVNIPAGQTGQKSIRGTVEFQFAGMIDPATVQVLPDPLVIDIRSYHDADYQDPRWQIDGTEASRVLAYWRAQGYHLTNSLDGYATGPGDTNGSRHSADYAIPYWVISGSEVNRVLTFWRAGRYHVDPNGLDGFAAGSTGDGSTLTPASYTDPICEQAGPEIFVPGQLIQITNTIRYENSLWSLLWRPVLPGGWTLGSVVGQGNPELIAGEILWTGSIPPSPIQMIYTLQSPTADRTLLELRAEVEYQAAGMINATLTSAVPMPLTLPTAKIQLFPISDGHFTGMLLGEPGRQYLLQSSVDLLHWTDGESLIMSTGPAIFSVQGNSEHRFFRAKLVP